MKLIPKLCQVLVAAFVVCALLPAVASAKQKPAPTPTPAMGATGPTGATGAAGVTGATGATGPGDTEDRGNGNTASGNGALNPATTGNNNTAMGFDALNSNTIGYENTANGFGALETNTTGRYNTANGDGALQTNTTGQANTANGDSALNSNTHGDNNTANGVNALASNTTGSSNTANGVGALEDNTTGISNTANGDAALQNNTTGNNNTALGFGAGVNLSTGDNNIDVGNYNPNTFLSSDVAGEANTIRIGYIDSNGNTVQTATYVAGINGVNASAGSPVYILSTGQLGTGPAPAQVGSNFRQTGTRAVAELERKITAQEKTIAQLKSAAARQLAVNAEQKESMAILTAQIKEQNAKIQRVSDKVELNKPAPRTVDNIH